MVAGHLREKKGYFYAVLNYTDAHGNRKTKWIATGLAVKGNKKRAEAFLQEQRRSFPGRCADYRRRSFCRLHGTMAYGNKEFRGGDNFRLILQYGQKSNRAVFQRTADCIAGAVGKTHPGFLPEGTGTCERVLGYSLSRKHPQGVEVCCQARPNLQ